MHAVLIKVLIKVKTVVLISSWTFFASDGPDLGPDSAPGWCWSREGEGGLAPAELRATFHQRRRFPLLLPLLPAVTNVK